MSKVGIRDWAAKQTILRSIFCVGNNKALVNHLVSGWCSNEHVLIDEVEKCYDTFRKWGKSIPNSQRSLNCWQQIISDLQLKVKPKRLWTCNIVEFVDFLSHHSDIETAIQELLDDPIADSLEENTIQNLRNRLSDTLGSSSEFAATSWACPQVIYSIECHPDTSFEGPETGINDGQIQGAQFYNVPAAASAWSRLLETNGYRMYLECVLSLKKLMFSEDWKKAINSGHYPAVVTLAGGGSPEKDWMLAKGVLEVSSIKSLPLDYVIVDISRFMIHQSAKPLYRRLVQNGLNDKVNVRWVNDDILKLDVRFPRQKHWTNVVWAILGGTIGNLSEMELFLSIGGPSKKGDLLIVGIDTHNNEPIDQLEERMSCQYECTETDSLLLASFSQKTEAVENTPIVKLSVATVEEEPRYSDVPDSRTAIFKKPMESKDLILAISTRYNLEEFLNYAVRYGWEHICTTRASEKSTFRQLLFRRVE